LRIIDIAAQVEAAAASAGVPATVQSLAYDNNGIGGASRVVSVTECGASECFPPTTFGWQGSGALPDLAATSTLNTEARHRQLHTSGSFVIGVAQAPDMVHRGA
jgi:hypothetical protein